MAWRLLELASAKPHCGTICAAEQQHGGASGAVLLTHGLEAFGVIASVKLHCGVLRAAEQQHDGATFEAIPF
ncbi:hypothetical protein DUNSADRAFT_2673 [Dunaliella salina]|uniref:Uncharacterized protein n=1 Tax=Dunaliella salina TaxID=3046 RepID=A0ABQ7H880_DUNSA|nr:hypothetical protein DUNSADRAFT_2673 [Dunaliella salina]|eukprot:KAF5843060.1 hypothetical protein DUNSADRAFT_2673 [Dunaliella salina]